MTGNTCNQTKIAINATETDYSQKPRGSDDGVGGGDGRVRIESRENGPTGDSAWIIHGKNRELISAWYDDFIHHRLMISLLVK